VYVELKRSQFFEDDANISIADLFLDELATHPKASELLFDHVNLCENLKHDEYRVPPLVVQAFEGGVLEYLRKRFKERWMDFVEEDAVLSNGVVQESLPEENDEIDHPWIPPLVLLVRSDYCQSTEFWFEVAKLHISGIGPDKKCLLPSPSDIASNNTSAIAHAKREAKIWVAKAHSERLAVHPWTVRLEVESERHVGGVPPIFQSAEDELRYYFCGKGDLKIDGVFSENVASAQMVGAEGCELKSKPKKGILCIEEERNLWLLGLSFLAIGTFIGSVLSCFFSSALVKRGYCGGRRGASHSRGRSLQLREIDTAMDQDEGDTIL